MAENVLNVMKDMSIKIQEIQEILNRIEMHTKTHYN